MWPDIRLVRSGFFVAKRTNRDRRLTVALGAEGVWRGIWREEAHRSTAIEGNTLVLKQVEELLEEGRAIGAHVGRAEVADWIAESRGLSSAGPLAYPEALARLHAEFE
jgi:hypothetical protein